MTQRSSLVGGLGRRLARWAGRAPLRLPLMLDGRSEALTFGPRARQTDGWAFDVADEAPLYLIQPGNSRQFQTVPPTTAIVLDNARRLIITSRCRRPLPRGCQLRLFVHAGDRLVGQATLSLSDPASQAAMDLPAGPLRLSAAVRLSGRGRLAPQSLTLTLQSLDAADAPAPDDAALSRRVADALAQGQGGAALQAVETALSLYGPTSARLRLKAQALGALGLRRRAVAVWDDAVALVDDDKDAPKAWLQRREDAKVALSELGDAEAGSRPAAATLRVPPPDRIRDAVTYHRLGLRRAARGALEAIAAADDAEALDAAWALVRLEAAAGEAEPALQRLTRLLGQAMVLPGAEALRVQLLTDLGREDEARAQLADALAHSPNDALHLAAANLAREPDAKLAAINAVLAGHDLAPLGWRQGDTLTIDTLAAAAPAVDGPLVTVIVPAFNAADSLETALRSLAAQSWRNLEVLIIDDASTDASAEHAAAFAASDPRFRLIRAARNGGPYQARNLGLAAARGVYVTCHDADDWAHPQRLQRHIEAMMARPGLIATLSRCVTGRTDLTFTPRSATLSAFRWNLSSLTFRREAVLAAVGYWDTVRFAGDGEYIARLTTAFGPDAIGRIAAGPLSVVRQSDASLTATAGGGLDRAGHTLRHEYRARYEAWQRQAPPLRVEAGDHPFPAPPGMFTGQGPTPRLDLVLASDFTRPELASEAAREIEACRDAGLSLGLMQMHAFLPDPRTALVPEVRALIDDQRVRLVTADQSVDCETLVVLRSQVLASPNDGIATVRADRVVIRAAEAPCDRPAATRIAEAAFGRLPTWAPSGSTALEALTLLEDQRRPG